MGDNGNLQRHLTVISAFADAEEQSDCWTECGTNGKLKNIFFLLRMDLILESQWVSQTKLPGFIKYGCVQNFHKLNLNY